MNFRVEASYWVLRDAILRRRCLTARYGRYVRLFMPFALGIDREAQSIALVFQYGGGSPGGLPIEGEWLYYRTNELRAMEEVSDAWREPRLRDIPRGGMIKVDTVGSRALLQILLADKGAGKRPIDNREAAPVSSETRSDLIAENSGLLTNPVNEVALAAANFDTPHSRPEAD